MTPWRTDRFPYPAAATVLTEAGWCGWVREGRVPYQAEAERAWLDESDTVRLAPYAASDVVAWRLDQITEEEASAALDAWLREEAFQ